MSQVKDAFRGATTLDILAWHRPIASGIVLGAILATWLVFVCCEYTLVTFLSRILQIIFIAGAAATVTKRANFSASEVSASVDKAYEKIRPCVQNITHKTFDALCWKDFNLSMKVFISSFILAYIGNYLSDTTFALLVVVATFSLPAVYEKHKPEIDAQLRKVQELSDKYLGMLKTKGEAARTKIEEAKDEASAEYANRKNQ